MAVPEEERERLEGGWCATTEVGQVTFPHRPHSLAAPPQMPMAVALASQVVESDTQLAGS